MSRWWGDLACRQNVTVKHFSHLNINRKSAVARTLPRHWLTSALSAVLVTALALLLLTACRSGEAPNALLGDGSAPGAPWPTPADVQPSPTVDVQTTDPLVPTVPAVGQLPAPAAPIAGQTVITRVVTTTATWEAMVPPAAASTTMLEPGNLHSRLGVGVPLYVTDFVFDAEMAQQLGMGWYLDWQINPAPIDVDGLEYAQLYAMRPSNVPLRRDQIAQVLAANPGALWLAGNEPDVIWQDNKTPEEYAQLYHQFYTFVKTLDPSAQVAIAGVSQVTPLRLQYLEAVMAAYERLYGQPIPVDVWNVHAFILREDRDSWGVSIPPGFDVDQGMLWEIEDHDDLDLFRQQIIDFRRWMLKQGARDKPLIVSEFGILMPADYGFPPERVAEFMTDTFDYLLTATDPDIGYPADDNRLVQRLNWYSLSDTVYPTSNLVDPTTGKLTLLGHTFADYAAGLKELP
jgi:hypothetical protein